MPRRHSPQFNFEQLTVSGVSRHYGRRLALNGVSLTLRSGELVGLLGPNGAGKSTLLGLLATLIEPSKGSVRYGDSTARDAGVGLRSQIGFLSHDLQLYSELTARENLEFFAALYGLDHPARRAGAALEGAGLAARADDLVQGYSGACASGSRWSVRSCISLVSSCLTNRSPGSTRRQLAPSLNGCEDSGTTGAWCSWRHTISIR